MTQSRISSEGCLSEELSWLVWPVSMPVRIFLVVLANCGGKIYPECELHHFMSQIRRLNEKETDDYMAHIYKFTPPCIHSLHDYGYSMGHLSPVPTLWLPYTDGWNLGLGAIKTLSPLSCFLSEYFIYSTRNKTKILFFYETILLPEKKEKCNLVSRIKEFQSRIHRVK